MSLTRAQADAIAAANAADMIVKDERILALERQLAAAVLQPVLAQPAVPAPPAARTADLKGVRLPEFWSEDPLLWFEQAEAAFESCLVFNSRDRYILTVARLSPLVAKTCRALLIAIRAAPAAVDPYEQLRDHLIRCYSRTDWQLGFAIMDSPAIGDRRPSVLLQDMRALQPTDGVENTLFKCHYLRRLPAPIRDHLLAVGILPMDEMAVIADRLHDSMPSAATAFSVTTDGANAVQARASRSPDRSRGAGGRGGNRGRGGRGGGRNQTPKKKVFCANHWNFGADCKRCIPPCDWSSGN